MGVWQAARRTFPAAALRLREKRGLTPFFPRLNPFEIRAWLALYNDPDNAAFISLNPFEIRAWLARALAARIVRRDHVLIPLKSGHGWH